MKNHLAVALLVVMPLCAHARQNEAPADLRYYPPDPETVDGKALPRLVVGLRPGMPFLAARKRILADGWKPRDFKTAWPAEETPDCCLLDCQLHRRGVIEVEGCPTDKPVCVFYYAKGTSWLQLMATGERLQDLKIYYWSNQAPRQQ